LARVSDPVTVGVRLASDGTRKIEAGLQYPGQIKVTVVRETCAVELQNKNVGTIGDRVHIVS
jgi:hypothetical protein